MMPLKVFALGLLCLALCGIGIAQPPPGGLSGTVVTSDGLGLTGVTIRIRSVSGEWEGQYVTGEQGVFRMSDVPAGTYRLTLELAGYRQAVKDDVRIRSARLETMTLTLDWLEFTHTVDVIGTAPRDEMTGAELRETAARDVGEAVGHMAGLSVVRKGGIAADIVLRGYQGSNLNVLIDGMRVQGACPNNMDPAAFHVDLAEVERVEVSSGPFDMKNAGSLGGAVNIVTRRPDAGLHAESHLSVGTFGYVNPSATVTYGGERFSAHAGFSYRRSAPYKDGRGRRFTDLTDYRDSAKDSDAFRVATGWLGVSFRPAAGHRAWLTYSRQAADHVLYPYLQMDAVYDDTDRLQFGYENKGGAHPWQGLRLSGFFSRVNHWMTNQYRTASEGAPRAYAMGSDARTRYYGGRAELELVQTTLGMELTRRDWNMTTMMAGMMYMPQYSLPDVHNLEVGAYVTHRHIVNDRLLLELGGRLDHSRSAADPTLANTDLYQAYQGTRRTESDATYPTGDVRIEAQLTTELLFKGGIGTTARYPDPRELFFGLRRMGSDWVGNPRLDPARNVGLTAGAEWQREGVSLRVDLYRDTVYDYITPYDQLRIEMVPGVMNTRARSYANVDARLWGGEAEASVVLGTRWYLAGSLSAAWGRKDPRAELGMHSPYLAEMPPLNSRLVARYDTGRLFGEIEGLFFDRQDRVDTDLREAPTPGYGQANLRFGLSFRSFHVALSLNNLFDRFIINHLSYQRDPFRSGVRVPEPGRSLTLNLGYRF